MIRALRHLRQERGIAVPIALMICTLMLAIGLAILALTDRENLQAGGERVQENSLSLAEGALTAQSNLLAANWPGASGQAFTACTQASTSTSCADAGSLLRGFTNHDFTGSSWSVSVRDNGLGNYYDDTATASQPNYDASGPTGSPDNLVWMRAQATARGRTRVVVALLRAFPIGQNFPRGVVTAGSFSTSNNGKKAMVDPGSGPGVNVRCTPGVGAPQRGDACLNFVATKGQIWPPTYSSDTSIAASAMSASDVSALRTKAKAAGTWFASCPANLPSATLVFIESGNCSYTGSSTVNSSAVPGLLVVYSGGISLGGSTTYYGVVYCVNSGGSTSPNLVDIGGNAQIIGAVVVDGAAGVTAGSSKMNIIYDANAFNSISLNSSVNIVANTWRELNGHSGVNP
jgi:Tfp pilus assembly protein PilX